MAATGPRVGVLVGSPRRAGNCARFAARLEACLREAGADPALFPLPDYEVAGCTGCGACEKTGACVLGAREGRGGRPGFSRLLEGLLACEALALVAPVYFSGPPSQLKAALDRMQPLWCRRYLLGTNPVLPAAARKPLHLFIVGAGGDPFGHDALVSCARSSLRMADFELAAAHDLVGFGQPARPGTDYGCERDALLLAQACQWAAELVRDARRFDNHLDKG